MHRLSIRNIEDINNVLENSLKIMQTPWSVSFLFFLTDSVIAKI